MNVKLFKYIIVFAVIILVGAVSGCVKTPVDVGPTDKDQILAVEGMDKNLGQKVDTEWENIIEAYPQFEGIDFARNEGYGLTRITFNYMPDSSTGIILVKKAEDDYINKSKADYYISSINVLMKKESGEVYDPGMIVLRKDVTRASGIPLPKEKIVQFKVVEVMISPR